MAEVKPSRDAVISIVAAIFALALAAFVWLRLFGIGP
jgi:hypothetical protein